MSDEERERIEVSGPLELDQGYFELRVNFGAGSLLAMTGEDLERFRGAIATLKDLAGVVT